MSARVRQGQAESESIVLATTVYWAPSVQCGVTRREDKDCDPRSCPPPDVARRQGERPRAAAWRLRHAAIRRTALPLIARSTVPPLMLAAVAAHQATAGYNDRPGSMVVGMPWARRRAHEEGGHDTRVGRREAELAG